MARTSTKSTPERRRRPGRPSLLTYELADQIIALSREGNYMEVAARACGISKQRIYDWLAKGSEFDDASEEELAALDDQTFLYVWFADAQRKAEALAETDAVREISSRPSQWQARAWFLERRFQSRWRRKDFLEHGGSLGMTVQLTPEQEAEELAAFGMPAAIAVAAGPDAVEPPANA